MGILFVILAFPSFCATMTMIVLPKPLISCTMKIIKGTIKMLYFNFIIQYLMQNWFLVMITFVFQSVTYVNSWMLNTPGETYSYSVVIVVFLTALIFIMHIINFIWYRKLSEGDILHVLHIGVTNRRWVAIIHFIHFMLIWTLVLIFLSFNGGSFAKWIILLLVQLLCVAKSLLRIYKQLFIQVLNFLTEV